MAEAELQSYWLLGMVGQPLTHIRCPACECAVRVLDGTPCPNCRRCAFCGRKQKRDDAPCNCAYAEDPDSVAWFWTEFIVPEKEVARESRRMEIRRQLETRKGIVVGLLVGLLLLPGITFRHLFGDFTWIRFALYVICLSTVWILLLSLVKRVFQKIEDRRLRTQNGFHQGTENANN